MKNALDILRDNGTLMTAFLLRHAAITGSAAFTEDRAERFLLWFALEGRREFRASNFSPAYLAFLSAPTPPYASRLAAYVAAARPDLRRRFRTNADLFHAWYYGDGAASLGLIPFISQSERQFLCEMHPAFHGHSPSLSRAAYYAYLRNPTARATYDLTSPEHRARVAAEFNALGDPLEPHLSVLAPQDRSYLPGCNVFGFADGILGLGEDARALTTALGHAGISHCINNMTLPDSHAVSIASGMQSIYTDLPLFPINIFAITAFETARLFAQHGSNSFSGRYNIGYWPWELTTIPHEWKFIFDLVDEIWAPSQFLLSIYSSLTDKPVVLMPPLVAMPPNAPMDLALVGIDREKFVFLTMFDFNSFVSRKNPHAAINAFKAAFPDRQGPERMIVKSLNAQTHQNQLEDLRLLIGDDDRFVILDGAFSRPEIGGLIAASDCFVSLHRSEGFGRVLAEAMLLRTPVIATNWSGNMDYLKYNTGFPIEVTLRSLVAGEYVFWEGSEWAEPSLDSAVAALRHVAARPRDMAAILNRAHSEIANAYGLDTVAEALVGRIGDIACRFG